MPNFNTYQYTYNILPSPTINFLKSYFIVNTTISKVYLRWSVSIAHTSHAIIILVNGKQNGSHTVLFCSIWAFECYTVLQNRPHLHHLVVQALFFSFTPTFTHILISMEALVSNFGCRILPKDCASWLANRGYSLHCPEEINFVSL